MTRARINLDRVESPDYPWSYAVMDVPEREDLLAHGRTETLAQAFECVEYSLTHPDEVRGFTLEGE